MTFESRGLEPEHQRKRRVDGAELSRGKPARRRAEAGGVDDARLLDEHAGSSPIDLDERAEARGPRCRRGGRDEDGAEPE